MNPTGRSRIEAGEIRSLLLIRPRRIGDVVMTTPALAALRETFPTTAVSYLIEAPYRDLIEGHPAVDETIVIPRPMRSREFLDLIRSLRRRRYDAVVDFHGGPKAFSITVLSGARLRIGYRIPYKHVFYHKALPRRPREGAVHSVENHLNLIKLLGVEPTRDPDLSIAPATSEEKSRIDRFLVESGLEGRRVIVMHIGAGNRFRDWGEGHLAELTDRLAGLPEAGVVLAGAPEDRPRADRLLAAGPEGLVSAVGDIGLRELGELLSRAALFVGADSGPMHIAAAASAPIVALFGPTRPAHFAPWRGRGELIEKDYECRPCRQRECIHTDFRCLQSITPDEVFAACLRVLSGNRSIR